MARIAGLSKDIADMALQLIREGADVDVALNSAARLSDATPKQVEFADDLLRRRKVAQDNLYDNTKTLMSDFGKMVARGYDRDYNPNSNIRRALFRENKSLEPQPQYTRISRTPHILGLSRVVGRDAAENRLRQELALAAAEGNPERMQTILTELGFLPDYAYNIARQYSNPEQFAQLRDPNFIPGM